MSINTRQLNSDVQMSSVTICQSSAPSEKGLISDARINISSL